MSKIKANKSNQVVKFWDIYDWGCYIELNNCMKEKTINFVGDNGDITTIDKETVKELLPYLQNFVANGELVKREDGHGQKRGSNE